jgi:transposase
MSDRFDHTLELITGTGRRRRWSSDEKARILVESLKPGANISEVARRNGLSPQQLFGWRREVREPEPEPRSVRKRGRPKKDRASALAPGEAPAHFAPVVIAAPAAPPSPPTGASPCKIEITIGDAVMRVSGQVDISLLAVVLRAVRRAS